MSCVPDRRVRGFLELLLFSRNTGPAHTDTRACAHTHIYIHTHTRIHTHTYKHTHKHAHTHTCTHIHTHTHTGAYTCTHACAQMTTDHKEVLFF